MRTGPDRTVADRTGPESELRKRDANDGTFWGDFVSRGKEAVPAGSEWPHDARPDAAVEGCSSCCADCCGILVPLMAPNKCVLYTCTVAVQYDMTAGELGIVQLVTGIVQLVTSIVQLVTSTVQLVTSIAQLVTSIAQLVTSIAQLVTSNYIGWVCESVPRRANCGRV